MQNRVALVGKTSKKMFRPGYASLIMNGLGYVKF